jgi:hypothetical protein
MPHTITLPDDLFAKLQAHAVPLVDTPLSIIERAIAALEAGDEQTAKGGQGAPRSFNPAAAPSLSHTTPHKVMLAGKVLPASSTYWNPIMYAVIEEAAKRGVGKTDLLELITVNCTAGEKTINGYKFLPGAGISVQGQDANAAWRQAYRVASSVGIALEVQFAWQDNEKAAMPNTLGSFFVEGQ